MMVMKGENVRISFLSLPFFVSLLPPSLLRARALSLSFSIFPLLYAMRAHARPRSSAYRKKGLSQLKGEGEEKKRIFHHQSRHRKQEENGHLPALRKKIKLN